MEVLPHANIPPNKQIIKELPNQQEQHQEKRKNYFWLAALFIFLLLGFFTWILIKVTPRQAQKTSDSTTIIKSITPTITPTVAPTAITKGTVIAMVKDNNIYLADANGNPIHILDLHDEEYAAPKSLGPRNLKVSPDKKYLAYIGTSGGLDSAIKVIDINQKKKIYQMVYGSSTISDFSWAPDSKQFVVAVNLMHNDKNYTSWLDILNPFNQENQEGAKLSFNPENIEITRVEWVENQGIYYSRISYGADPNAAIVLFDIQNKTRTLKIIGASSIKNASSYADISSFTIDFIPSSDKTSMLAYVAMKDPESRNRGRGYSLETLSLPSLETKPAMIIYVLPKETVWFKNYLVGIEQTFGSPDSSVVLFAPDTTKNLSLLDMGPSGSFHSVKLFEEDGKTILLVWSEFDGENSISAYDLEKLIEMRKKAYTSEPLWTVKNFSSLGLSSFAEDHGTFLGRGQPSAMAFGVGR